VPDSSSHGLTDNGRQRDQARSLALPACWHFERAESELNKNENGQRFLPRDSPPLGGFRGERAHCEDKRENAIDTTTAG
jgi:hypothetical protein